MISNVWVAQKLLLLNNQEMYMKREPKIAETKSEAKSSAPIDILHPTRRMQRKISQLSLESRGSFDSIGTFGTSAGTGTPSLSSSLVESPEEKTQEFLADQLPVSESVELNLSLYPPTKLAANTLYAYPTDHLQVGYQLLSPSGRTEEGQADVDEKLMGIFTSEPSSRQESETLRSLLMTALYKTRSQRV